MKATCAQRVVSHEGGHTISLNLSPDIIEKALNDPHRSFASHIKRRFDYCLNRDLHRVPGYWFTVDVEDGRLHVHGGVLVNDNEVPALRRALKDAGGKWANTAGKQFQLEIDQSWNDGWAAYVCRNAARVQKIPGVGTGVLVMTNDLRARAKLEHEKLRRLSSRSGDAL